MTMRANRNWAAFQFIYFCMSSGWPRAAVPLEYVCQLLVLGELLYIHAAVDW